MTLESLLSGLTPSEKLAAMELLWRDLIHQPADYASPEWHSAVLSSRLSHPASGAPLPLRAAQAEVQERFDARRTTG